MRRAHVDFVFTAELMADAALPLDLLMASGIERWAISEGLRVDGHPAATDALQRIREDQTEHPQRLEPYRGSPMRHIRILIDMDSTPPTLQRVETSVPPGGVL